MTVVMMSAVLAVGGRRKSLIVALVLLAPALVGKWINHFHPDLLHPAIFLTVFLVFLGFVVARLLSFIVHAPQVDVKVLCAGVAGFLLLGVGLGASLPRCRSCSPRRFHPAGQHRQCIRLLGWLQRLLFQLRHTLHRRLW